MPEGGRCPLSHPRVGVLHEGALCHPPADPACGIWNDEDTEHGRAVLASVPEDVPQDAMAVQPTRGSRKGLKLSEHPAFPPAYPATSGSHV